MTRSRARPAALAPASLSSHRCVQSWASGPGAPRARPTSALRLLRHPTSALAGSGMFLMALFSTTKFATSRASSVAPNGAPLGDLDMTRFRLGHKPGEPEKAVLSATSRTDAKNGCTAPASRLRDGSTRRRATWSPSARSHRHGMKRQGAENIPVPASSAGTPFPGRFYRFHQGHVGRREGDPRLGAAQGARLVLPKGSFQPVASTPGASTPRRERAPRAGRLQRRSLSAEAGFSVAQ